MKGKGANKANKKRIVTSKDKVKKLVCLDYLNLGLL